MMKQGIWGPFGLWGVGKNFEGVKQKERVEKMSWDPSQRERRESSGVTCLGQ